MESALLTKIHTPGPRGLQMNSDYESLPDGIKAEYTEQQYLWLSDAEKARLIQKETEPESEL